MATQAQAQYKGPKQKDSSQEKSYAHPALGNQAASLSAPAPGGVARGACGSCENLCDAASAAQRPGAAALPACAGWLRPAAGTWRMLLLYAVIATASRASRLQEPATRLPPAYIKRLFPASLSLSLSRSLTRVPLSPPCPAILVLAACASPTLSPPRPSPMRCARPWVRVAWTR